MDPVPWQTASAVAGTLVAVALALWRIVSRSAEKCEERSLLQEARMVARLEADLVKSEAREEKAHERAQYIASVLDHTSDVVAYAVRTIKKMDPNSTPPEGITPSPRNRRDPGSDVVMNVTKMLLILVTFTGCSETRTSTDTQTSSTLVVTGHATAPGGMVIPLELKIEQTGGSQTLAHSKTQLDSTAIAQQLGGILGKTIDAAFAKLTGFQSQPSQGFTAMETGLGTGAGGLALLYGREWIARRREERALENVKRDRAAAQAEALDLAKRLPV